MKARLAFAVILLMVLPCVVSAQSVQVSWDDAVAAATDGPADYFVVWRSDHPDTGFVEYANTTDTVYVDADIPNDSRIYYRISSVRGYLLSEHSGWVSLRWIDYTSGIFNTPRIHEYYPGDDRVLLVVWPPNEGCEILSWEYGLLDLIGIKCDPSPFAAPATAIE